MNCEHCSKELKGKQRRFCSRSCNENFHEASRRKEHKRKALEYKGNKCQKCDYSKCDRALQFHHLDPSQKDFSLASNKCPKDWERIKVELDKCILLCANCHAEEHDKLENAGIA